MPRCRLPYLATKQEAEQQLFHVAGQMPIVIARLGDVVGPGQYGFTISFIEKIRQGQLAAPVDTASGTLNPVYIDNLLDALLLMSTHPAAPGQAFNVVDGTPIRMSDYIRRLAVMVGKTVPTLPAIVIKSVAALQMVNDALRGREGQISPDLVDLIFLRKATINGHKIRDTLGWSPAIDQEEAFCLTEQWLRQEGYLNRN